MRSLMAHVVHRWPVDFLKHKSSQHAFLEFQMLFSLIISMCVTCNLKTLICLCLLEVKQAYFGIYVIDKSILFHFLNI